jgi:NAD+ synthase
MMTAGWRTLDSKIVYLCNTPISDLTTNFFRAESYLKNVKPRDILREIERLLEIDPKAVERKLRNFLRRKVEEAKAKGVILGLSGGVDSAATATLSTKALGKKRVTAFFLPEQSTTPALDEEDARLIAGSLGITLKKIDISPLLRGFHKHLEIKGLIPAANLKARVRMCILYYHANLLNRLVVGTGNRSELRSGYFTKYGDGGCDILPIGCLYKTQVKVLARHLGIPERIIGKTPSAGLWRGQTDEAELGLPYEKLDKVYAGLDLGCKARELAKALGLGLAVVEAVIERERSSIHKLRPPEIPVL